MNWLALSFTVGLIGFLLYIPGTFTIFDEVVSRLDYNELEKEDPNEPKITFANFTAAISQFFQDNCGRLVIGAVVIVCLCNLWHFKVWKLFTALFWPKRVRPVNYGATDVRVVHVDLSNYERSEEWQSEEGFEEDEDSDEVDEVDENTPPAPVGSRRSRHTR